MTRQPRTVGTKDQLLLQNFFYNRYIGVHTTAGADDGVRGKILALKIHPVGLGAALFI